MFVKVNKDGSEYSCFKEGEIVEKVGTDVFRRIHGVLPEETGLEQFLIKGQYTVITEHSVGDKLVALRDRPHSSGLRENDVVEFVDVALDGCLRVKDKDSETWYVLDSHVKACTAEVNTLVTEDTEYKVGDKVVITSGKFYERAYKEGTVVTIIEDRDSDGDYKVHASGCDRVYVGASQIKPYVEPQLDMFGVEPKKYIFTGSGGEFDKGSIVVEIYPDDTDSIRYFKGTKSGDEVIKLLYENERELYTGSTSFDKAFSAHTEPSTVKVDTNYQVNLNLTTEQLRDLRDCLGKFGNRINAEHPVANDVFMELKRHLTLIGSNS